MDPITQLVQKFNIGGYPAEYNHAKHGPYDPARYYGKSESVLADIHPFC